VLGTGASELRAKIPRFDPISGLVGSSDVHFSDVVTSIEVFSTHLLVTAFFTRLKILYRM